MIDDVRIVENPISGKILLVQRFGFVTQLAKAFVIAAEQYPDRLLEGSCDGGQHIIPVTAKERREKELTSVDYYEKICAVRGMRFESYMFDIVSEEDGRIRAEFNKNASPYERIYDAALDAVMLSRAHDNTPVEFSFRDKTVSIKGTDEPMAIESSFPPEKRGRQDYVPPPPPPGGYYR
ncbi:MAG TPA: hypothetical protein VIG74_00425 [Alphaproteobacteria bacterium]|jgi:hypothetical protein